MGDQTEQCATCVFEIGTVLDLNLSGCTGEGCGYCWGDFDGHGACKGECAGASSGSVSTA